MHWAYVLAGGELMDATWGVTRYMHPDGTNTYPSDPIHLETQ